MVALVDYEAGNLTSVETALSYLGWDYLIASEPEPLLKADKVIVPGVGEAAHAMKVLRRRGLDEALKSFALTGKPLLGICLGCQVLLDHSEEQDTGLLGLLSGEVSLFPADGVLKVPQIGWNTIRHDGSELFQDIDQDSSFYFLHSYYIDVSTPYGVATAHYGRPFVAALHRENVWGTQFHPEKSGPKGLILLRNFLQGTG